MATRDLLAEDIQRLKQAARDSHVPTKSKVTGLNLSENSLGVPGGRCIATLLDPNFTAYFLLNLATVVLSDHRRLQLSIVEVPDLGEDELNRRWCPRHCASTDEWQLFLDGTKSVGE